LALNPNFARGWHISGVLRNWSGQPDIAITHAETALRLSPHACIGLLLIIGSAHFFQRRFDEAENKAPAGDPGGYELSGIVPLFGSLLCSHGGRIDNAK
jgi:hypothetical protein